MDNLPNRRGEYLNPLLNPMGPPNFPQFTGFPGYFGDYIVRAPETHVPNSPIANYKPDPVNDQTGEPSFLAPRGISTFNEGFHPLAPRNNYTAVNQPEFAMPFQAFELYHQRYLNPRALPSDPTTGFPFHIRGIQGPPDDMGLRLVRNRSPSRADAPNKMDVELAEATIHPLQHANDSSRASHTSTQTPPGAIDNMKDLFMTRIKDILPDICETTLGNIYTRQKWKINDESSLSDAVQESLDDILTQPFYPKQKKPKRTQPQDETDMQDLKRAQTDPLHIKFVLIALGNEFPFVQHKTIRTMLSSHKNLLDTYEALYWMEQPKSNTDRKDPLARLRRPRPKQRENLPVQIQRKLEQIRGIVAEKEAALKLADAERAVEEEHRKAGTLVECQCCFIDVAPNLAIVCRGQGNHIFCRSCIKKQAETQAGLLKYNVKCIDVSGCQAEFPKAVLQAVVGDKLMKRLEFLQQMDEIEKAGIEGLEGCPFCEFKAICLPVEQDKEFPCQNPECGRVSCRLCREETHIPKTCEEAKKERGIPERREVEEAMTKALLRTCPKCGISIVKEDGCNKIQCRCGTLICDVCKADITKKAYGHFSSTKCPQFETDFGRNRLVSEVHRAGKAAIDKIVAEKRDILREQLHVDLPPQPTTGPSLMREQIPHVNLPRVLIQPRAPHVVPNYPFHW